MPRPFADPAVKAAYDAMPAAPRTKLLRLRELIFDEAASIGPHAALLETLKWGEPAYLPKKPRIGTTLRLNALKGGDGYALYFPCMTTLADTYRALYGDALKIEGSRAIVFGLRDKVPEPELRHCIALALTYHRERPF
jgi:Domain of unknown function (DU1801)